MKIYSLMLLGLLLFISCSKKDANEQDKQPELIQHDVGIMTLTGSGARWFKVVNSSINRSFYNSDSGWSRLVTEKVNGGLLFRAGVMKPL